MQAYSDAQEASLAVGQRVALLNALFLCSGPSAEKRRQALPSSRILFLTTEHEARAGAAVQTLPGQTSSV